MTKSLLPIPVLIFVIGTAACGGSSPTGPDPTSGTPGTGASITGSVQSGGTSAMTAASSSSAMPGLIVTVAGTSISSGLDVTGRFHLKGVPAGDIQLQFSGPVTGSLSLSQVKSSETITLVVSVTTSSVTLQSQGRSDGGHEQLEGLVEAVPPTVPAGSIKVAGRTVTTDASTQIREGNTTRTIADLRVGYRVHVAGQNSGSNLLASFIQLQSTNVPNSDDEDDDDDDEQDSSSSIHGKIQSIGGSAPSLTLNVGGTTVRTTSSTEVKRRGDVQTLAELKVGQDVHVVGKRQPDGSIDARMIQINDDETGGEVEISGSAGGVSGTCPSLSFGVNGYSIRTNGSTTFQGLTCASMKSGTKVTVKGTSQADNSVVATLVKAQ